MEDYLSTREAAASLRVTYSVMMRWIYDQKISVIRRGRWYFVPKSEVERMRTRAVA